MAEQDDIRSMTFGGGTEMADFMLPPPPLADGTEGGPDEPDFGAWATDFHGLLKLGYLSSTFEWCGHRFVIHTLRQDEELIIASMIKQWQETVGGTKAYATAIIALCIDLVDGQRLPIPLGEETRNDAWAWQRFSYVQRWYPFTIDAIYEEYLALETRVKEVIRQMGKGSAPVTGSSGNADSPDSGDSSQDVPSL